ncbi:MAG: hypothetical protein M0R77_02580 [Gammaproteobacteria bacterium]|nr:hypothetical protein [Gammaproteobacteria bacterium]
MLIQKQPSAGDLIAIKLVTGEEIVGRIEDNQSSDAGSLTLKSPVGWMLTQQGVMPAPFMVTADDKPTITFSGSAIISRTTPRKEISDAYTQITTGIVPASAAPAGGMFTKG